MSPRAALRLESLGFSRVFDYTGGKTDWAARGLPMEGPHADIPQAKDAVDAGFPTCSLGDTVGSVRARLMAKPGAYACIVLGAGDVVLGRLWGEALGVPDDTPVEEVMEEGPTSTRADRDLAELAEAMAAAGVETVLVTDPEGRLLGVVESSRAEEVLASRWPHEHS